MPADRTPTPEERARMILMQHDFDWETFDGITDLPEWPPPLNDLAEAITDAIASAVEAEREACERLAKDEADRRSAVRAKLLDSRLEATAQETGREAAENIRAAIRARKGGAA